MDHTGATGFHRNRHNDVFSRPSVGRERLAACMADHRLQQTAMIDDYANMANAALALYEVTGETAYLTRAEGWVEIANQLYWDDKRRLFSHGRRFRAILIVRIKTANEQRCSSRATAAWCLCSRGCFISPASRPYRIVGGPTTVAALEVETMKSFPQVGATFAQMPSSLLESALQVVIVGDPHGPVIPFGLLENCADLCVLCPNLGCSTVLVIRHAAGKPILPGGNPVWGGTRTAARLLWAGLLARRWRLLKPSAKHLGWATK